MIDEFYDYCYGELEYRSLRFETEVLDMGNYQGDRFISEAAIFALSPTRTKRGILG
mgnify:CR=1 FL=1